MPMAILTPTTMGRGECWNPRPSSWGHSPHRSLGRCRDAARGEGCPQKCRSGRSYSNSYSYSYSKRWLGVLGGDRGSSPSTALRAEYEYEYGGGRDRIVGTLAPPEWMCCGVGRDSVEPSRHRLGSGVLVLLLVLGLCHRYRVRVRVPPFGLSTSTGGGQDRLVGTLAPPKWMSCGGGARLRRAIAAPARVGMERICRMRFGADGPDRRRAPTGRAKTARGIAPGLPPTGEMSPERAFQGWRWREIVLTGWCALSGLEADFLSGAGSPGRCPGLS